MPTVMLFVQSLRGLTHTKVEDTKEEHLELSVAALDRLATKTRSPTSRRLVALGPAELRPHSRTAVVAGLVVGCFLTWNVTNVGAVADPLSGTYGVSLAAIGLLTTALFVTHLPAQLPPESRGPLRHARSRSVDRAAGRNPCF